MTEPAVTSPERSERERAPAQAVALLPSPPPAAAPPTPPAPSSAPRTPSAVQTQAHANIAVAFAQRTWDGCRSWQDFFSTRAISFPSFSSLSDRIGSNLTFFRENYLVVAAGWVGVSVLSSIPSVLIAGGFGFLLSKMATRRAAKNGGTLTDRDRIKIGVLSLLTIWVSGIYHVMSGALFWAGVSVGLHSALHREETVVVETGV